VEWNNGTVLGLLPDDLVTIQPRTLTPDEAVGKRVKIGSRGCDKFLYELQVSGVGTAKSGTTVLFGADRGQMCWYPLYLDTIITEVSE